MCVRIYRTAAAAPPDCWRSAAAVSSQQLAVRQSAVSGHLVRSPSVSSQRSAIRLKQSSVVSHQSVGGQWSAV